MALRASRMALRAAAGEATKTTPHKKRAKRFLVSSPLRTSGRRQRLGPF